MLLRYVPRNEVLNERRCLHSGFPISGRLSLTLMLMLVSVEDVLTGSREFDPTDRATEIDAGFIYKPRCWS